MYDVLSSIICLNDHSRSNVLLDFWNLKLKKLNVEAADVDFSVGVAFYVDIVVATSAVATTLSVSIQDEVFEDGSERKKGKRDAWDDQRQSENDDVKRIRQSKKKGERERIKRKQGGRID